MVELEPGEKIIGEPHIGDSVRWEVAPTASGSGPDSTPILIIKPRISGLDTTMVVPTDRLLLLAGVQTIDHEGPYDEDNTDGHEPNLLADASGWRRAGI